MPETWRHHYLPEFYLKRWNSDGRIWRFARTPGPGNPVHARKLAPREFGYEPHLYRLPQSSQSPDKAVIETHFFKPIDDAGAVALRLAEEGSGEKHGALVQFLLSLIYRTPSQIQKLRDELNLRMESVGFPVDESEQEVIHEGALKVLVDLVTSEKLNEALYSFSPYLINLGRSRDRLLTSDRPIIRSLHLSGPDAFFLVPVRPDCICILANNEELVGKFARKDPKVLVRSVNDAVVRQADRLVIGNLRSERHFVEKRLQKYDPDYENHRDRLDGLIRWKAPD